MKLQTRLLKKPGIDLIPLMDSMFLILVFFIFAMMSMVMHKGVDLDLPEAVSAVVDQQDYVSVSVSSTGDIYMNEQLVSLDQLKVNLAQLLQTQQSPKLYVASDKESSFGRVMQVLDLCRQMGIYQVSFETEYQNEH